MESRSIRRWAQSMRDKIMRFLLVAFIACLSGVSGVAQCPIQPRAASLDASRKNFTYAEGKIVPLVGSAESAPTADQPGTVFPPKN